MIIREYLIACLSLSTAVKNIGVMFTSVTTATWTLLKQATYHGLMKDEREDARDRESLLGKHVYMWTYMLSLVSFLALSMNKSMWAATCNVKRKSLFHKEMNVSEEEKERSKNTYKSKKKRKSIYKSVSSKKQEQRQIGINLHEPKNGLTTGFSQEMMKESDEVPALENNLRVKKKKKNRRKKTIDPDFIDDTKDWQTVKKKNKKNTNTYEKVQEEDVNEKVQKDDIKKKYTEANPLTETKKKRLMVREAARDDWRDRLRQQWVEEPVQVLVEVPPCRRHHVIGKQGEVMRKLREKYPAVRLSVPIKEDLVTAHVKLDGPKGQVAAAKQDILGHLQAIDEEICEAKRRRKANMTTISLEVDPKLRRYVVGPRGERLGKLTKEHPNVRVRVPSSDDTTTRSVTLTGPKEAVNAVKESITAHLKATEAHICEMARRREATKFVVVSMEVDPEMRRFIVGPGGETLLRLAKQHPRVRVNVPAADDKSTRSITLRGPTEEVVAVQASLKNTLHTAQQQLEAGTKRRTKLW